MSATEDAKNEVVRLCNPGETWSMSVPANPDRDSDLILMDALVRLSVLEDLVERIKSAEPTWHRGMYGCPDDMFSRRDLRALLQSVNP